MTTPSPQPLVKRLLPAAMLVIGLLVAYLWLSAEGPDSQKDWDANRQNLPDIAQLEQRIELDLFGEEAPPTEGMGPDLDQPIDIEAMEAKLAGLTKNVTTLRQPTDQELIEYYQKNQSSYREISKFSFRQILFSRSKHGGQAYLKAQQAQEEIKQGTLPAGDSSDLRAQYNNALGDRVDREFGDGFASKLLSEVLNNQQSLPIWTNPIASNYGVHLVCIEDAVVGDIPDLKTVRSQVINDWRFSVAEAH